MGVASLVLGIVSVVIAVFFSAWGWLAGVLGIIGIILAAVSRKKAPTGAATAGLVLSIIGTLLGLVTYLACVACVAGIAEAASSF